MRVIDAKRRSGIAIAPDKSLRAAAQIMEQAGVGALAIVEGDRVVGVVTDRDLVRRAMAKGLPLDARIDSVMSTPAITVSADADLHDAFTAFRDHPVRRLVVVRGDSFLGMLSVDDLLIDLAGDLAAVTRPVRAEVFKTQHDSSVPATV